MTSKELSHSMYGHPLPCHAAIFPHPVSAGQVHAFINAASETWMQFNARSVKSHQLHECFLPGCTWAQNGTKVMNNSRKSKWLKIWFVLQYYSMKLAKPRCRFRAAYAIAFLSSGAFPSFRAAHHAAEYTSVVIICVVRIIPPMNIIPIIWLTSYNLNSIEPE